MSPTPNPCKAVFLDRDGVINREKGSYIFEPGEFDINAGVTEALRIFRDRGFILVVITNQSGIAQGLYTHAHVDKIHCILREQFKLQGIDFAEIYYCPHHPSTGKCLCRKPGSILIEKAIGRFGIDPSLSYMIGDRPRDIEAAERAGIKGILIDSNDSLMNYAGEII